MLRDFFTHACAHSKCYDTQTLLVNTKYPFKNRTFLRSRVNATTNFTFHYQTPIIFLYYIRKITKVKSTACLAAKRNEMIRMSTKYEGYLESKERFAIKKYLLIIGKKKNKQVLSHTFTYFST